jgi:hypothetical protein
MAKKEDKEPTSKSLFGEPVKVVSDEKMKSTEPGLFDYIGMMFKDPSKFTKLHSYTKAKQFFMAQRFFSIKFPIQAQMFNHININGAHSVQYWCDSLSKINNSTPQWIFNTLRDTKKQKEEKKKENVVDEETLIEYCKRMQCSKKDLETAIKFYPEKMNDELNSFEKMLKGSTLKK